MTTHAFEIIIRKNYIIKIAVVFLLGTAIGVFCTRIYYKSAYNDTQIVLTKPVIVEQNKKVRLNLPIGTEMILNRGDYKFGYNVCLPLVFDGIVITAPEDQFEYKIIEKHSANNFVNFVVPARK